MTMIVSTIGIIWVYFGRQLLKGLVADSFKEFEIGHFQIQRTASCKCVRSK